MARTRKLSTPVTLFVAIEQMQHDELRRLAFERHRSLADLTRDALTDYLRRQTTTASVPPARRRASAR